MVDPSSLAVLGGSAALVAKLLGPTADYIGEGMKLWAEARVDNVKAIFSNAESKLGVRIQSEGVVSPRVLKEILQEGSYSDDPVGVEYFGGILASSRTETGGDDRGAAWAKLLAGLSTYVVRAHFVLYALLAREFRREPVADSAGFRRRRVWIDREEFISAIGLTDGEEAAVIESVAAHVFFTLHQYDLLGPSHWNARLEEGAPRGVVAAPSASGAELFLWAMGDGHSASFVALFDAAERIPIVDGIELPETVQRVEAPERESETDQPS